jgi:hypothetical protein
MMTSRSPAEQAVGVISRHGFQWVDDLNENFATSPT